ncbi:hypothetical protein F5879DRAFT_982573, partial [Lentinula edodes]
MSKKLARWRRSRLTTISSIIVLPRAIFLSLTVCKLQRDPVILRPLVPSLPFRTCLRPNSRTQLTEPPLPPIPNS